MATRPHLRLFRLPARPLLVLGAVAVLAACSSTTDGRDSATSAPSVLTPTGSSTPDAAPTAPTPSTVSSAGSSSTAAITPAPVRPTKPLRTITVTGSETGTTYVIKIWAARYDATCADHAYGAPITNYLRTHPCDGMERLLATTTVGGRAVGFSQISTGFKPASPTNLYGNAGGFVTLVEKDGTGSINDLLREGYRLPSGPTSVPSPDAFSCLGQDSGVTIYDLWYLDGPTPDNAKPLVQFTQDTFLQYSYP